MYYKVWITLIKDLGIKKYRNLIKIFKTNKNIFYASAEELLLVEGIDKKMIEKILNFETRKYAKKHLQYMILNNIDIISIFDNEYPQILREIYGAPVCLYIKGDKKILNSRCVAIIGCRECTKYGIDVAKELSYNIAKNNITIVSGLAKGIDSVAHKGTILAKGRTIGVLGTGLDNIYPLENKYLVDKIIETGGAVISEFPLGTKPSKFTFPARNRIISGISKAVVVVEAKKKSGTLITVDFALEQGRDVLVVPRKYNIYKFRRNQ